MGLEQGHGVFGDKTRKVVLGKVCVTGLPLRTAWRVSHRRRGRDVLQEV